MNEHADCLAGLQRETHAHQPTNNQKNIFELCERFRAHTFVHPFLAFRAVLVHVAPLALVARHNPAYLCAVLASSNVYDSCPHSALNIGTEHHKQNAPPPPPLPPQCTQINKQTLSRSVNWLYCICLLFQKAIIIYNSYFLQRSYQRPQSIAVDANDWIIFWLHAFVVVLLALCVYVCARTSFVMLLIWLESIYSARNMYTKRNRLSSSWMNMKKNRAPATLRNEKKTLSIKNTGIW